MKHFNFRLAVVNVCPVFVSSELLLSTHLTTSEGWTAELTVGLWENGSDCGDRTKDRRPHKVRNIASEPLGHTTTKYGQSIALYNNRGSNYEVWSYQEEGPRQGLMIKNFSVSNKLPSDAKKKS